MFAVQYFPIFFSMELPFIPQGAYFVPGIALVREAQHYLIIIHYHILKDWFGNSVAETLK